ncbi:MAG: peptidylprolyl isomerase, partial [Deltaproteobacteria bacterium]|nr:peptidylprolyl isomerase [Deltaproteobacteria bacterium]
EAYKKAKAKAEELQKKAAAGEDFAKLCKENSEDPGSKDEGGDLGFFTRDRMVDAFASAAFKLKVAQVSEVVETQFGFHVIKLTERQDAVQHGFDEVKEDIAAYLKGQALDAAVKAKLVELKKSAKIEFPGANKK